MGRKGLLLAVLLSIGGDVALAFAPLAKGPAVGTRAFEGSVLASSTSDVSDDSVGRRVAISRALSFLSVPFLLGGGLPAYADVYDGNSLPQGAAQFGRLVRAKSDMITVSKRVATGAAEMDTAEWNNVGQFLRKVYAVGEDMKSIANGLDPEKKKKAAALIDDLKKYSKAADGPTGSKNGPEFLAYAKKITGIFDDFLDLLNDVPDEL